MALVDVTTETVIERPLEEVRAFTRDPLNAPRWYASIASVAWRSEPVVAVGSEVEFVARFLGRELRYTYALVELDADHLVMRTAQGPFPMETGYRWTALDPARTRMGLRNRGEPHGFAAVGAPLVAAAMRRANVADLARLKALLERTAAG